MKKTGLILTLIFLAGMSYAQVITNKTSKSVTVGFDVFTDLWLNPPADMKVRAINQGFNVHATYNFPLGETAHSFAIGTGLRTHNLFSNAAIPNLNADTITFVKIDEKYKRNKVNLVYLDFPMEFRFRFDDKWKLGVGFKLGIEMDSKTKYVGENAAGNSIKVKQKDIAQLEKYTFGPTLRFGYKFVSVFGYYQISSAFQRDLGPELAPISVGITISPF